MSEKWLTPATLESKKFFNKIIKNTVIIKIGNKILTLENLSEAITAIIVDVGNAIGQLSQCFSPIASLINPFTELNKILTTGDNLKRTLTNGWKQIKDLTKEQTFLNLFETKNSLYEIKKVSGNDLTSTIQNTAITAGQWTINLASVSVTFFVNLIVTTTTSILIGPFITMILVFIEFDLTNINVWLQIINFKFQLFRIIFSINNGILSFLNLLDSMIDNNSALNEQLEILQKAYETLNNECIKMENIINTAKTDGFLVWNGLSGYFQGYSNDGVLGINNNNIISYNTTSHL